MKFIRKNGRIIPIKERDDIKGSERSVTHKDNSGKAVKFNLNDKKVTAGQRFKEGFKAVAPVMAALGGIVGLVNSRSMTLKGAALDVAKGAAVNAAAWGGGLGALNAAFGSRKRTVINSVEKDGKKITPLDFMKKKKKK